MAWRGRLSKRVLQIPGSGIREAGRLVWHWERRKLEVPHGRVGPLSERHVICVKVDLESSGSIFRALALLALSLVAYLLTNLRDPSCCGLNAAGSTGLRGFSALPSATVRWQLAQIRDPSHEILGCLCRPELQVINKHFLLFSNPKRAFLCRATVSQSHRFKVWAPSLALHLFLPCWSF